MIGLGQAETAHLCPVCQPRQIALLLFGAAEGVQGMDHQRVLHAEGGTVTGIDALYLARHQPIGDRAQTGAAQTGPAMIFGQGHAQQAVYPHPGIQGTVKAFMAKVLGGARGQFGAGKGGGAVTHLTFIDRPGNKPGGE